MAEKRIYELTAQDQLNSDDYIMVDKSGNTAAKKVPGSVIVDQFADMNNILGAKNLLPNNAVTVVLRGITWTINSDGTITANGTATGGDSTLYYVSSTNDSTVGITIPAGKYTYSCLTTEGSDSTYRSEIYNLTNPSRIGWDYGEGVTFTRSVDTKVLGSINIRSGATVSNITFKPMLRPAAVDNSYVPFAKSNKQLTEDVTALNSALNEKILASITADGIKTNSQILDSLYAALGTVSIKDLEKSYLVIGNASFNFHRIDGNNNYAYTAFELASNVLYFISIIIKSSSSNYYATSVANGGAVATSNANESIIPASGTIIKIIK